MIQEPLDIGRPDDRHNRKDDPLVGHAGRGEPTRGAQGDAREVFAVPDPAVFTPITIHEDLCIGCNLCVFVCQADLFLPNAVKGGAPLVVYGAECWYEGSCVDYCPVPGAIELNSPLVNRVQWK